MSKGADRHLRTFFNQVMIGVGIAAFFVHAVFLYIFHHSAVRELFYFNIASLLLFVVVTTLSLNRWTAVAFALTGVEVILHAVAAVYYIGWDSGFHFYIILLVPVILFGSRSFWFTKLPLLFIACAVYIALEFQLKYNAAPVYTLSYVTVSGLHLANSAIFLMFLSFLCGIYSLVVHQSVQRMYQLANSDMLSGLKNRRAILETADVVITKQLSRGYVKPDAHFVICDIDHFKRVNDTYGHEAGDAVIRAVADVLQSAAPVPDYCARWGGEEFLILIPALAADKVATSLERIRAGVEILKVQHEEHTLCVTMTFGVARMRRKETVVECIDRADKALYNGKQTGRNKVVFTDA